MTVEELQRNRESWRKKALSAENIGYYRVNYDPVGWSEEVTRTGRAFVVPVGATFAIERLCCEVERLRKVLNGHEA